MVVIVMMRSGHVSLWSVCFAKVVVSSTQRGGDEGEGACCSGGKSSTYELLKCQLTVCWPMFALTVMVTVGLCPLDVACKSVWVSVSERWKSWGCSGWNGRVRERTIMMRATNRQEFRLIQAMRASRVGNRPWSIQGHRAVMAFTILYYSTVVSFPQMS